MSKKKICVIASSRATYGYKKYILKYLKRSNHFNLQVIVTGMHLEKKFGYTVSELIKDKVPIKARVPMNLNDLDLSSFVTSLSSEMSQISKVFTRLKPDIVLVTGDRAEMFIATIASVFLNIPVAHIQAGDVSGHIDGNVRHAITKLSHIHFASCKDSYERVLKLGEEKRRVFNVGAPQLDEIRLLKKISKKKLFKRYNLNIQEKFIIILQHPIYAEINQVEQQIQQTLKAIQKTNLQSLIIFPNIDPGNKKIINLIKKNLKDKMKFINNIPRIDFLNLLKHSSVLIGNSSCGILEAPSFKVPVINIGNRQRGRMQSNNVINVDYYASDIYKAINFSMNNKDFLLKIKTCKNPYGDGKSSKKIIDILSKIKFNDKLLDKSITY